MSGSEYDVVVLGGGLAGLTLALQLKRQRPETSIFVAERREGPAPQAAFKVGESTVEVGADYFGRVCGMRDHLEHDQLLKAGLRFFFPAGDNSDITRRLEWGERSFASPVHTYQLDRGRFENELGRRCLELGVDLRGGHEVVDVELGMSAHRVAFTHAGTPETVQATWVVDSAGRSSILKRKLGLEKAVAHAVNAVWWRVGNGHVDVEQWGAHDQTWIARMERPGIRMHSTCHLVGEGYWVWLIPLAGKSHSIGIVADPRFHSFEQLASLDGAMAWLRLHEPQLADELGRRSDDVLDFLTVEHFAHGCARVYSPERWAITGDAGVFIDPLYSPGSDYIAAANQYAADLIKRDLAGEDVSGRVEGYNFAFLAQFESSLETVWTDHYAEFGDAEVLSSKLVYDYVRYWGLVCPFEYYDKYGDSEFTQAVLPDVLRASQLGATVQQLFRDWHTLGQPDPNPTGLMAVTSTFAAMWERLLDLGRGLDEATLRERLSTSVGVLEGMAVVYFHKACRRLAEGPPDPQRRVDPYAVSVHPERWDADQVFSDRGLTLAEAYDRAPGIENMMVDELVASQR
jgi:flavin-dependent dehydrogenase